MTMCALSPPTDSDPMELDPSTLSAAASLAKTLARQVRALASPESAQDSGDNSLDSLARYDPATQSWKTWQLCLDGGWTPYSETFPRWGTMRRGQLMAQQPWGPHTAEREFSSSLIDATWPTPRVAADRTSRSALLREGQWAAHSLGQVVELAVGELPRELENTDELTPAARRIYDQAQSLWPTPVADGDRTTNYAQGGHSLGAMARLWPTPNASQGQQGENDPDGKREQTWTTPKGSDGSRGDCPSERKRRTPALMSQVAQESALWPTPTTQDGSSNGSASQQVRNTPPLNAEVQNWRTPMADENGSITDPSARKGHNLSLSNQAGGQLNPAFVEALMNFPEGWTNLDGPHDQDSLSTTGKVHG